MTTDLMTDLRRRFRPGQSAPSSSGERVSASLDGNAPAAGETPASLAEQVISAHARATGAPAPMRLEAGPEQVIPTPATASRILDAYHRARRLQEGDKDNPGPGDYDSGPDQRPIVATAAGIIRAMKLARGER
jgi:hypothetical protein